MTISRTTLTAFLLIGLVFASGEASQKAQKPAKAKTSAVKKAPPPGGRTLAVIQTNMGTIEAELYSHDAPKTVENFVRLAEKKYFSGVSFHRVSKGFVIQGGDPTATGSGGQSIWGKEFADELNPATPSYKAGYKKGTLAMANRGPNTNTSQFFIMLNDVPNMPKNYTIFGKVVKGIDVVEAIGKVDIVPQMGPNDGKPVKPVIMKGVTIKHEKTSKKSPR